MQRFVSVSLRYAIIHERALSRGHVRGHLIVLLSGFPVAFCLAGTALIFAGLGLLTGHFDSAFLSALPSRIYGIMSNETLIAVPLFVFMGVVLERAKIAEDLLESMSQLFGGLRGGLGISVCLVGGLLAASTGIVGATVVTMGLISLPAMQRRNYSPELSTGIICASGTLGQIIPPSIVLVILGDVVSSAHQQAQLKSGQKLQATSYKTQATSYKLQETSYNIKNTNYRLCLLRITMRRRTTQK